MCFQPEIIPLVAVLLDNNKLRVAMIICEAE